MCVHVHSLLRFNLQANLDKQAGPSYLTAAAGPPTTSAARKFCSVCGNTSP